MILTRFQVGGRPRTKGSLNGYCLRNAKHTVRMEEEVEHSKSWRMKVARACREAQLAEHGKFLQYPDAVEVRLVFFFPRPAGATGETEWPTHITLGDADKLARNVLDALSMPRKREEAAVTSGLIMDDSQVVLLNVGKFWVSEDSEPGVQVQVLDVTDPAAELDAVGWL